MSKNTPRAGKAAAGQKRGAPSTPAAPKATQHQTKKAKTSAPATTPRRAFAPAAADNDEEESDDDAAIFALKAKASAAAIAAAADADGEDDFEVAAGGGDDDDDAPSAPNAPPSDLDDDEDENMNDADESEEEAPPPAKPVKRELTAPSRPTPAPTPAAKPTPAKSTVVKAEPTPAKPATAVKSSPATKPAAPIQKADSDSETSDSDDEQPAPTVKRSTPVAPAAAAALAPVAAKPAAKPLVRAALDDSSESSESDDEVPALPATSAYRKPQAPKKPTPLQGDASVNPPAKKAQPPAAKKGADPTKGTSTVFDKPMSRPPTAPHTGRNFTVTIALPGSIIANAQSKELRSYVAGQIARAAATFNVDEIVVFAEAGKQTSSSVQGNFDGATRSTDPDVFMVRILQYLETPQYLRKLLFPKHVDLSNAGLLNPLDSPHHVRADEETAYREGVVVKRPVAKTKEDNGCWANIGLKTEAFIDRPIEVGTRVTVHIPQVSGSTRRKSVVGRAVAPSTPREKHGTYWGYTTRLAQSLSHVWSECPYPEGYDLSVGTSEHGVDCHAHDFDLPPFKHLIIFFGGLAGLEEHIAADESINVKRPEELFQMYINSVIGQGCRTIRTEEAVPITLAALYRHIRTNQPPQAPAQ